MSAKLFTLPRWAALCTRLGAAQAGVQFGAMQTAYAEPVRAYHTAQHIGECLVLLDSVASQVQSPDEIELAIWLHDVVYEPQAHDNEERSAQLALQWFADLPADSKQSLTQRILATKGHAPTPHDSDCQALLDIDLAILASSPARFAEYGLQVRHEYSFVPEAVYALKRRQFMQHMAQRPQLYFHPSLAPTLERAARLNLSSMLHG
jgi:predicted metal-dependent HD superfamily phosphohydrolase